MTHGLFGECPHCQSQIPEELQLQIERRARADMISVDGGRPMTWREYSDYQREQFMRLRAQDRREIKALTKRCHRAEAALKGSEEK